MPQVRFHFYKKQWSVNAEYAAQAKVHSFLWFLPLLDTNFLFWIRILSVYSLL